MPDQTAKFFAELENAGHQPLLAKASGSLRFELTDGNAVERWRVDVRHGDVAVSHKAGAADCVLRAPKPLFDEDRIGSGERDGRGAARRVGRRGRPRPAPRVPTHPAGPASEAGSETSRASASNVRKGASQWPMTW